MFQSFFHLASASPTRRRSFRNLLGCHLAVWIVLLLFAAMGGEVNLRTLGNTLLVAGIVEGALMIGWRLTQLPKSQALEFLLVTQMEPARVLLAEGLVCIWRFVCVTCIGLPFLIALWASGLIGAFEAATMFCLPLTWGLATGLGLTAWAYEPLEVRMWGERLALLGVLAYLFVGILVGENLPRWLNLLPEHTAEAAMRLLLAVHEYNPFGAMHGAMIEATPDVVVRTAIVVILGGLIAAVSLWRAALRLLPHFHDLHYRPVLLDEDRPRPLIGQRPLSWWAIKRVSNYSGRINLYLAAGFTLAYSAYLLAGPAWPNWLGKNVFLIFESMGGIPMLTTALVLLGAVPAAFQYGLWDHNAQDRSRRLELLLLTDLDGRAYWDAAVAAAWRRGRGYFVLAGVLWLVGAVTGSLSLTGAVLSAAAAVGLWGLYFAIGFWAFSRGIQANGLGIVLTLLVPLATFLAYHFGATGFAAMLPPGNVFFANSPQAGWVIGPVAAGLAALAVGRFALNRCDASLRLWYQRNHGVKAAD